MGAIFGIGLWLILTATLVVVVAYLIIKRIRDRDKEDFEKRKF